MALFSMTLQRSAQAKDKPDRIMWQVGPDLPAVAQLRMRMHAVPTVVTGTLGDVGRTAKISAKTAVTRCVAATPG